MVVLYTGMIAACVMDSSDHDRNVRQVNSMWKELGMTGRSLEATVDNEGSLQSLFRAAARQQNTPVTAVSFPQLPPDRHQANGRAERAVQTVKRGVAANLLFLESRLRKKVALESPLLKYLVPYVARTYNIFHVPQASDTSAFDKMRGRKGGPKPTTLPFAVSALAKPTEASRVHDLEQLCEIVYLGPASTSGGGMLGILAGDSRVGVSHEESIKLRKFQAGRVKSPCEWSWEDLKHLVKTCESFGPRVFPESPVFVQPGPDIEDLLPEEPPLDGEDTGVVVPVSGPPKQWVVEHGPTPSCTACDSIAKRGTAHSKVHSSACKKRYKGWLETQAQALKKRQAEGSVPSPGLSGEVVLPGPPRRVVGKQPPNFQAPAVEPGGSLPAPVAADGPSNFDSPNQNPGPPQAEDVEMAPPEPVTEPMEVDALIDHVTCERENMFLMREFNHAGEVVWFESECLGQTIWQSMPKNPTCEATGKPLHPEQLKKGLRTEHQQLTKLMVGTWISEEEAKQGCKQSGTKLLGTRWVLVQKPDKVRARLVCKDFRSAGLSSFREDCYSPTASLESLRLLLSLANEKSWFLCTSDVSTAFMFASLGDEYQVVALPSSTVGHDGGRLFLRLWKALYGLRKAPLYWFKELRSALLSLGFTPTSEATVFRFFLDGWGICLILIYVDDLLAVGTQVVCEWALAELGRKYEIKLTGRLPSGEPGYLEFLGREIRRESAGGNLSLGLPPSYFDSIEACSGWHVKASPKPPVLRKLVVENDAQLDVESASRYRTVLGKLAWFALTVPVLGYQIGWCSCYQQCPTVQSEKGLKEVLKFAKSFRSHRQAFGTAGSREWAPNVAEVVCVVDASWGVRSVMGGIVLCSGSAIKSWSRRVQTPCLSSAEAELHAIAEGTKESLALAVAVETFLEGLPPRDSLGIPVRISGRYPLVLFTDSESGQHISYMAGLLRRVKHVELRALLIQELTDAGRLLVKFCSGSLNPADTLTKSSDLQHLMLCLVAMGLHEGSLESQMREWTDVFVDCVGPLSPRNRARVVEGIERGLALVVPRSSGAMAVGGVAKPVVHWNPEVEVTLIQGRQTSAKK